MKSVLLTPEARQELNQWLLENLLGKHCNPVLQFLSKHEVLDKEVEKKDEKTISNLKK